jgi:CO/xanthine dehydrogenase Mo-binding subunit
MAQFFGTTSRSSPRHDDVLSETRRRTGASPSKGLLDIMKPTKFGMGQGIKRVEDVRLITGAGRYASDASDQAALRAVFVRSPYGHARFKIGDLAAARATPGIKGIFVASDFAELGGLPCLAPMPNSDGTQTPLKPFPVMSSDEVQHVGDIVAMVVADTAVAARDTADSLTIDWEELPAVTDVEQAIRPDAPLVFAGAPGNIAYDTHIGDKAETDAAFASAAQDRQSPRDRQLHGAKVRDRRIRSDVGSADFDDRQSGRSWPAWRDSRDPEDPS